MRISGPTTPARTAAPRPTGSISGFVLPSADEELPSAACEPAVAASVSSVISVCSAMAAKDGAVADREARRHGEAMLDALKSLQLAQLGGGPQSLLAGLAKLAVQGATASDPGLQAVVQAIAARAAVELARR